MAFDSPEGAALSRCAVAGLVGLATRSGIAAATTDHGDLTPRTDGIPPLFPRKGGGMIRAPDVVLINLAEQLVVGVEVEVRETMIYYPGATPAEVAKLREGLEVELSASYYARTVKGDDPDLAASWGQRDAAELLRDAKLGRVDFTRSGRLLILRPPNLRPLIELLNHVRNGHR